MNPHCNHGLPYAGTHAQTPTCPDVFASVGSLVPTKPNLHDLFIFPLLLTKCHLFIINWEAGYSVETLVSTYQTTRRHNPEVYNINLLLSLLIGRLASQWFLGHMLWNVM